MNNTTERFKRTSVKPWENVIEGPEDESGIDDKLMAVAIVIAILLFIAALIVKL